MIFCCPVVIVKLSDGLGQCVHESNIVSHEEDLQTDDILEERRECLKTCKSLGLALAVLLNGVCHCEDQERLSQAACYGECLNSFQVCLIPTKEEDPDDGAIGL